MTQHEILLAVITVTFLVLSVSIHEAAHAWVAYRCGDPTAKRMGRCTFNPIVHLDPLWSIVLPLMLWIGSGGAFIFGGARPVPVNVYNLNKPYRDMMLVALAGPISNLLQAFVYAGILRLTVEYSPYGGDSLMIQALKWAAFMNIILAVFNMIPIPPLDGSRVLRYFLPNAQRDALDNFERYGILLIMGLLWGVPSVRIWLGTVQWEIFRVMWFMLGGGWL